MAWDDPQPSQQYNRGTFPSQTENRQERAPGDAGILDPLALIRFFTRNLFKIALVTIVIASGLFAAFSLLSFPFQSTAIVLVDPRDKRITLTEDVLPSLGADAAGLESIIQLITSDGFLMPVLEDLDIKNDPEMRASTGSGAGDVRRQLSWFKSQLSANRQGATYLVHISFKSKDANKAARYANAVANAFLASENGARSVANEDAVVSLENRVEELRLKVQKSEKAVADFKAAEGIVDLAQNNTLRQAELLGLTQQIAVAKTTAEQAKARYEQVRAGRAEDLDWLGQTSQAAQLAALRTQRTTLAQRASQLNLTFGSRHPQVQLVRQQLTALDGEITREKRRLAVAMKKEAEAAAAALDALNREQARLRVGAADMEAARVQLSELQREASANQQIYEQFLARLKATDQERGIKTERVSLQSAAIAPLKTTRPSLALVVVLIGAVSFVLATILVFIWEALRAPRDIDQQYYQTAPAGADNLNADRFHIQDLNEEFAAEERRPARRRRSYAREVAEHDLSGNRNEGFRRRASTKKRSAATVENDPVIGFVPEFGRFTENNADILYDDLVSSLQDAFQKLKPRASDRQGKVVLMSSWSDGEGKTLLAHGLAAVAEENDLPAMVLNSQVNSDYQTRPALSDPFGSFRNFPIVDPASLQMRGFDLDLNRVEDFTKILQDSRSEHALTVIDAATIREEEGLLAIARQCDATILVCDPALTSRRQTSEIYRKLSQSLPYDPNLLINRKTG